MREKASTVVYAQESEKALQPGKMLLSDKALVERDTVLKATPLFITSVVRRRVRLHVWNSERPILAGRRRGVVDDVNLCLGHGLEVSRVTAPDVVRGTDSRSTRLDMLAASRNNSES